VIFKASTITAIATAALSPRNKIPAMKQLSSFLKRSESPEKAKLTQARRTKGDPVWKQKTDMTPKQTPRKEHISLHISCRPSVRKASDRMKKPTAVRKRLSISIKRAPR
jgi:hypothetical protein